MPQIENIQTNFFSIEEKNREDLIIGFIKEKVDTTLISDGETAKDLGSINKMCTSIPTPFARLFLFDTAFKEIQKKEERLKKEGRLQKVHLDKSLYNYMISDCFDMLEFLFYYGARREFNVVPWNRVSELDQLSSNDPRFQHTDEHDRLANSLKDQFDPKHGDNVLKNVTTIYLFTWNDQPDNPDSAPVIIGGTSPFSLVYTSPNWIREKKAKGWEFKAGSKGAKLFDNDPTRLTPPRSLSERSERFKTFIYKMWFAYKGTSDTLDNFQEYISQSWNYYDKNTRYGSSIAGLEESYSKQQFMSEYPEMLHSIIISSRGKIEDNKVNVTALGGNWPIRCMPPIGLDVHLDYAIVSGTLPQERSGNEASSEIKRPLVLDNKEFLPGALYVENEPWDLYSVHMPLWQNEVKNYWERNLPGTNIPYPYLRLEDLLEEKIIGLADSISNKHFLTGNAGDVAYLPPLTRNFFKFFKLEDLYLFMNDGSFKLDNVGLPMLNKNLYEIHINADSSVSVTLHIPVGNRGQEVTLKKNYSEDEIIYFDDADADSHMNLSIFPFYQIQHNINNKYCVMLGYAGKVNLSFYKFNDLNTPVSVKQKERTNTNSINTRYYEINDAFDLIQVEAGDARGIVLPLFRRIKLGTDKLVFCIDFGTTNTHIAYGKENDRTVDNIQDFFYNTDDEQVVSLYNIGGYMQYKPTMKREFIPEEIYATSDGDKLSFPIRTTACTAKGWLGDTSSNDCMLFGDTSVGFFFLQEEQGTQGRNVYNQNIKWARGGKNPQLRQAYFDELMWLIKNKAVLNGGSLDFQFYFTYPQSMEGRERDKLYKAWTAARRNVKAGDPEKFNMKQSSRFHPVEGIVPWYAFRKASKIDQAEIYLNVDIGGGTIDLVYQDPDHEENYTYSARFAANDLWGDGIDEQSANKKRNAFISEYERLSFPTASNLQKRYETFKDNATDSADIISFLFKYDKDYRFTDHLQESPLMTLILMHFVSVTYYIGLILKKEGLYVPHKIGFTGMGSLYVKIISPVANEIAEIIKSVLRYQGFEADEVRNLKVILEDNPKVVTARGGVIFHKPGHTPPTQVENCVWGYDGESDTDDLRQCDVSGKMESVLTQVEDCMNYFGSDEFASVRSRLNRGWSYRPLDMVKVMHLARLSFKSWDGSNNEHSKDQQKDPIFFWPIKDLLFKYGFEI